MITISDPNFYRKLNSEILIKLIAIVDEDWGVSKNGTVPWSFEDDLKFFKNVTSNSTIIMGRKTFFSIQKAPLKNRINCVISSTLKKTKISKNFDNIFVFPSLEKAIKQYPNSWIIGGAKLYNYALKNNLVDWAIITQVHQKFSADNFMDTNFLKLFRKEIIFEGNNYDITSYLRD